MKEVGNTDEPEKQQYKLGLYFEDDDEEQHMFTEVDVAKYSSLSTEQNTVEDYLEQDSDELSSGHSAASISRRKNKEEEIIIEEDEQEFDNEIEEDEEFTRFISEAESMNTIKTSLQTQVSGLILEKRNAQRDVGGISNERVRDVQELLSLFGIPYIVAPSEAESQCAYLYQEGFVDGIITDDSDVFLFGGSNVYKNMFNQNKFVECYSMHEIEASLTLDRWKLIQLAFLLGSDYAEGVKGIGIVNALEILNEFRGENSLLEFKKYWDTVHEDVDGSKVTKGDSKFTRKIKKVCKRITLPENFPNPKATSAYLSPKVDTDPTPFQWGAININGIRDYLEKNLGWDQTKVDSTLIPMFKEIEKQQKIALQPCITSFFAPTPSPHKSKRLNKVFDDLKTPDGKKRLLEEEGEDVKSKRKKTGKTKVNKRNIPDINAPTLIQLRGKKGGRGSSKKKL